LSTSEENEQSFKQYASIISFVAFKLGCACKHTKTCLTNFFSVVFVKVSVVVNVSVSVVGVVVVGVSVVVKVVSVVVVKVSVSVVVGGVSVVVRVVSVSVVVVGVSVSVVGVGVSVVVKVSVSVALSFFSLLFFTSNVTVTSGLEFESVEETENDGVVL